MGSISRSVCNQCGEHFLRQHNRHDCAGMREVCLLATAKLEADGAA